MRARSAANEFRARHGLPAYVFEPRHLGREVAVVLVGNAKTMAEANALCARVRAIPSSPSPQTPRQQGWKALVRTRLGLSAETEWEAHVTINPLRDESEYFCTLGRPLPPRQPELLARPRKP